MRIRSDRVVLNPLIPEQWKSYSFHARFREMLFEVRVNAKTVEIINLSEETLPVVIFNKNYDIKGSEKLTIKK